MSSVLKTRRNIKVCLSREMEPLDKNTECGGVKRTNKDMTDQKKPVSTFTWAGS